MQWNTKRMSGMEKKRAAKARALGAAVKSEPGSVKREPGAAAASDSSEDEADMDSSAAARSLRMHAGAQPGNVKDDAVPMRLAELQLLFGEVEVDEMDV